MRFIMVLLLAIIGSNLTTVLNNSISIDQLRSIDRIHKPVRSDIGGLEMKWVIPNSRWEMEEIEPFIFLSHFGPQEYPPNNRGLPFGEHPHMGYEVVNIILQGDLVHSMDGNKSRVENGGVQWLTAGDNLVHSENCSQKFKAEGGVIEFLQLWVNLPSNLKDTPPNYVGVSEPQIPSYITNQERVIIHPISGQWNNYAGPIEPLSDVNLCWIELKKGGRFETNIDSNREILLYIINGDLNVNGTVVSGERLIKFKNKGEGIVLNALDETIVLFGHATPNNEPIVSRGPFVLNSVEKLDSAIEKYWNDNFGKIRNE